MELIEPTRSEKGSLSYELLENREDPTEFTFVEEWRDDKALKKHLNTPHVQNAIDEFPDILATEMDLRVYDLIEA